MVLTIWCSHNILVFDTPKAGFCLNTDDLPKGDDEVAPNVVIEVAPKAGVELPKVGDDEATKTYMDPIGEEAGVLNTPVCVIVVVAWAGMKGEVS
ncbi:hypothetical protein Tco_0492732 [Tanacetum coccineum]